MGCCCCCGWLLQLVNTGELNTDVNGNDDTVVADATAEATENCGVLGARTFCFAWASS